MSRIEIRGVIVPSNYDMEWMKQYIDKGIITPESYIRRGIAGADKKKPLELYINSPGGSVFAAYEVVNAITEWRMKNKQPVNITVGAMAASAASAIAILSGANLRLFRNSKMMFHGAWTVSIGGKQLHEDTADLLGQINADIKAQLVSKFGIAAETVDEWFAEGRAGWITAEDAVNYGMAETVIDDDDEEVEFADADVASIEENGMAIAAFACGTVRAEDGDQAELEPEPEPAPESEQEPEPETT
jgi:ATP-dependent protease ClpP protease subunit